MSRGWTSITKGWLADLEAQRYPHLAEVRRQADGPGGGGSLTWAVLERTASMASSSVGWGNSVLGSEAGTMADVERWAGSLLDGHCPVAATLDLAGRLADRVQADVHRSGLRQQASVADAAWVLAGIVGQLRVEARSRPHLVASPVETGSLPAHGAVVAR